MPHVVELELDGCEESAVEPELAVCVESVALLSDPEPVDGGVLPVASVELPEAEVPVPAVALLPVPL